MEIIYAKCIKCIDGIESIKVTLPGGNIETNEIVCRSCGGEMAIPSGSFLSKDFVDVINDIQQKCNDIFEKVNE